MTFTGHQELLPGRSHHGPSIPPPYTLTTKSHRIKMKSGSPSRSFESNFSISSQPDTYTHAHAHAHTWLDWKKNHWPKGGEFILRLKTLKIYIQLTNTSWEYFLCFLNFINIWLHWLSVGAHGSSLLGWAFSSCGLQASLCSGFSGCRAQALGTWASVAVARGVSSCSTWA